MASPLQNRIVGTVILVALAVIFLPDLLDGEKVQRDDELEAIPLRPDLSIQQQRADFPADFEQRVADAQPEPQAADDETDAQDEDFEAPPEPVSASIERASQSEVPAWVIRLGAFRNAENVERLVTELQDSGYNAFSRVSSGRNGELRVLLVGPDFDAQALNDKLSELNALTGLEGQVVPYAPTPDE